MKNKIASIFSVVILLLLALSLALPAVGAELPPAKKACLDALVGRTVQQLDPLIWNVQEGWSNRGALGNLPPRSDAVDAAAAAQGVHWWGQSISVAKSIEDAREHDFSHKYKNTGKLPYLITTVDVSDLQADTPKEVVQARLKQILDSGAEIIEFEDAQKANGKKIKAEKYTTLDPKKLLELQVMEDIFWFASDNRGPRFHFYGWTYPKLRGVVVLDDIFIRNKQGAIASSSIRKMIRHMLAFIKDGGTISYNTNFRESLDMARDQLRVGTDGVTKVQNSRYKSDPSNYEAALKAYDAGDAFSVEARNKYGELVAGEIVYRNGNMLKGDTVFYWVKGQDPRDPDRHYAEIAKATSVASAVRYRAMGIPIIDIGMMTPLSEEEGGRIVTGLEFAQYLSELNSKAKLDLDLNRPFTLDELPFKMEEVETWVPTPK